ncbi:unnamed protein product [Linum trigynum]|uniref:Uncharacterized protein n=1 Tax=Linum trigynum TaxID=586398 RepID=A0AAV2FXY3_9ROSI
MPGTDVPIGPNVVVVIGFNSRIAVEITAMTSSVVDFELDVVVGDEGVEVRWSSAMVNPDNGWSLSSASDSPSWREPGMSTLVMQCGMAAVGVTRSHPFTSPLSIPTTSSTAFLSVSTSSRAAAPPGLASAGPLPRRVVRGSSFSSVGLGDPPSSAKVNGALRRRAPAVSDGQTSRSAVPRHAPLSLPRRVRAPPLACSVQMASSCCFTPVHSRSKSIDELMLALIQNDRNKVLSGLILDD